MPKSQADIPPSVAPEYGRLNRPSAIAAAEGDGYAKTLPMKKAQQKPTGQFGLPRSPKRRKQDAL
jgi:hypothetical protein